MLDPLDALCFPMPGCPDGNHSPVYGSALIFCGRCGEVLSQQPDLTGRKPGAHECPNGCPPPPGPDFYNQLCGQCLDQVYEDWAREASGR